MSDDSNPIDKQHAQEPGTAQTGKKNTIRPDEAYEAGEERIGRGETGRETGLDEQPRLGDLGRNRRDEDER